MDIKALITKQGFWVKALIALVVTLAADYFLFGKMLYNVPVMNLIARPVYDQVDNLMGAKATTPTTSTSSVIPTAGSADKKSASAAN
jgi:hypothetical protein